MAKKAARRTLTLRQQAAAGGFSVALLPLRGERSPYREAVYLARKEGYRARMVRLMWTAHKKGDARATYALATWYLHGDDEAGFKISYRKGAILLRQAAKKGLSDALFDLAICYERGDGVKKSPEKAFDLYVRAARKDDPLALEEVVRCVYWGIGTSRNRQLAWLLDERG